MKKTILFILLSLAAIATYAFLNLSVSMLLSARGVEENLARLIGEISINTVVLGVLWLLPRFFKSPATQTIPPNAVKYTERFAAAAIGFLVFWLILKPLILFALAQSRFQSWARWEHLNTAMLFIVLGFIWWLERKNLADGYSRPDEE